MREKDMFQAEAEQMNKSMAALCNRVAAIKGLSDQLAVIHSSGGDPGPVLEKLAAELSVFSVGKST